MKHTRRTMAALVLGLLAASAQAALVQYTGKAAFDTAIGTYADVQTVNFDAVASGTTFASGAPATGGLTFIYSIPGYSIQVRSDFGTTSSPNYLGLDNPDGAFYLGDGFTIDFGRTVHAVGMYVIAGNDAGAGDFQLSVAGGGVLSSATPDRVLSDGNAFFLGLVESNPALGFTEATLGGVDRPGFLAFNVDDVTSAVAVPEPSTLALFAAGLGVLTPLTRRRRR